MNKRSQISPAAAGHTQTLLVQHVPASTKAAFKAACAKQTKTIRDAIIELMREFVARTNKL